jgi:hypothetical protein
LKKNESHDRTTSASQAKGLRGRDSDENERIRKRFHNDEAPVETKLRRKQGKRTFVCGEIVKRTKPEKDRERVEGE